jgi:RHS repeat-associated protein
MISPSFRAQRGISLLFVLAPFLFSALPAYAQVATGTPPFTSVAGGPDAIDLANLNSHIAIPVLHKAGRGIDFTYDLNYDSSVWYPVILGNTKIWRPVSATWGWQGVTPGGTSYITYAATESTGTCYDGGPVSYYWWTYNNFVYVDAFGVPHPFPANLQYYVTPGGANCPPNGPMPSTTQPSYANDGSGLTLYPTPGSGGGASAYVVATNGAIINPPVGYAPPSGQGSSSTTDRNGNQISSSNGVYTDTLGLHALTVAGSAPSNTTLTYTSPSGGSPQYIVKYSTYTVQTNFGCSTVTDYGTNGTTTANLVSEIDLPDGSKYTFTYEPTPGASGHVTGRLNQVALPTGGTITYTYTGGSTGHITCADGSASGFTRQTPDGSWTYTRTAETGAAYVTKVTDPQGNDTLIQFQGLYETQRDIYQGSAPSFSTFPISESTLETSNLKRESQTCYNTSTTACTNTAITLPITQRTITTQLSGASSWASALTSQNVQKYNTTGSLTEQDDYDYGVGTVGALLKKTAISYASLTNIAGFPQQITVTNGSGTVVSQTSYNYGDAVTATSGTPQHTTPSGSRGNALSVNRYTQGSTYLTQTMTYFDTGNVNTAADVNGATTTFNYSNSTATCGNSFPTSVSEPLSLSRSMTWNCTGGVQATSVDENIQTVTTTWNDPYFWRPKSFTDQAGYITYLAYSVGGTIIDQSLEFNSNNSMVNVAHNLDGLGRPSFDQRYQSPTGTMFDTVSYTYDANGRPYSTSMPCQVSAGSNCPQGTPKTTQTYDALNRQLVTTDGGGGTATYSYFQNDVLVAIGPPPTGENTKSRQLEYDALGRLTSVCEITSATGSGTCGQHTTQIGFWTKYTYDALGNLTGVTQNAQGTAQTRSYSYDLLSRLTSETNPESGTTAYSWDSATGTSCTATSSGDMIKRVDANGNWACFIYDALHRLTDVGNNIQGATNACKRFRYDNSSGYPGSTKPAGLTNTLGRLIEATTDACSTSDPIITDEWFSYTARGEVSDVYESTPHSGVYYHLTQTYWEHGVPKQLSSNISGLPTITYGGTIGSTVGLDGEGRITQVTASSGQNPVTAMNYNLYGTPPQMTATLGSGDSDVFSFDANTGRTTKYQFNVNGHSDTGTLTWNANGSLNQLAITDALYSGDSQTCTYAHDDLSRIASVNCGSVWSQTFSYDAFGNISKSGNSQFLPMYKDASGNTSNRFVSIPGTTVSYDAAGNVLADGLHTYSWDRYGKATTVDSVSLTYDALGRMVEQNRSGAYTEMVYSPTGGKLALMNGQTLYRGLINLPRGGQAVYNSAGLYYYAHSDHLGSLRLGSTPSRTVEFDLAHAPFGEIYASSGTLHPAFTGQRQDTVTGLYDFPAREYSTQGRWPSPDPAGLAAVSLDKPQTWNRYTYVSNNPLTYVDPLGMFLVFLPDQGDDGGGGDGDPFGGDPCFFAPELCGGGPQPPSGQCHFVLSNPCGGGSPQLPCLAGVGPLQPGQSRCNDPCANATLSAAGVNIQQNIAQAQTTISQGRMMGVTGGSYNYAAGSMAALFNYATLVGTGGPQDIKNLPGHNPQNQIDVDAGNISFGVTCSFGDAFCQFSAGLAQTMSGHPDLSGTLRTGFDTPRDNAGIQVGQAMRAAGCHE